MTTDSNKPQRLGGSARRARSFSIAMGVSICAGLVIGAITGIGEATGVGPLNSPLLIGALLVVGVGAVLWVSLLWWRDIDELAKQAHYSAWFWGGSVGMLGGWLLLSFSQVLPDPWGAMLAGSHPDLVLWRGGTVVALAAITGYGLAWAVFWLRRR